MDRFALAAFGPIMSWLLNKATGFESCLKLMKDSQWKGQEYLEDIQLGCIRSILDYAAGHVPYYADSFRNHGFSPDHLRDMDDLMSVPISTKSTMRSAYPDSIYSRKSILDMKTETSGSTGEPFECVVDGQTHSWRMASRFLFDSWMGIEPRDLWLRISTHPMLLERIRARVMGPEVLLPIEYAAKSRFPLIVSQIDRHKPAGLLGVPSSIALLAKHIDETGLKPKHVLKGVVCTGETFPRYQRPLVSSVFGKNVFDRYGLREFGGYLAQDCEYHRGLHVNSLLVYPEILVNGEVAEPGRVGRLVLTDLRNYAMPLIRYDTGDFAAIEDRCECGRGFPVLTGVIGRQNEYVSTKLGVLPSMAVTEKFGLAFAKDLLSFQFIQLQDCTVVVNLVPKTRYDDRVKERIVRYLATYFTSFELNPVREIEPDSSGKRPVFKSMRLAGSQPF